MKNTLENELQRRQQLLGGLGKSREATMRIYIYCDEGHYYWADASKRVTGHEEAVHEIPKEKIEEWKLADKAYQKYQRELGHYEDKACMMSLEREEGN